MNDVDGLPFVCRVMSGTCPRDGRVPREDTQMIGLFNRYGTRLPAAVALWAASGFAQPAPQTVTLTNL